MYVHLSLSLSLSLHVLRRETSTLILVISGEIYPNGYKIEVSDHIELARLPQTVLLRTDFKLIYKFILFDCFCFCFCFCFCCFSEIGLIYVDLMSNACFQVPVLAAAAQVRLTKWWSCGCYLLNGGHVGVIIELWS